MSNIKPITSTKAKEVFRPEDWGRTVLSDLCREGAKRDGGSGGAGPGASVRALAWMSRPFRPFSVLPFWHCAPITFPASRFAVLANTPFQRLANTRKTGFSKRRVGQDGETESGDI